MTNEGLHYNIYNIYINEAIKITITTNLNIKFLIIQIK